MATIGWNQRRDTVSPEVIDKGGGREKLVGKEKEPDVDLIELNIKFVAEKDTRFSEESIIIISMMEESALYLNIVSERDIIVVSELENIEVLPESIDLLSFLICSNESLICLSVKFKRSNSSFPLTK